MSTSITLDGMNGQVDLSNGYGVVRFGSDQNVNVLFYMKSVPDSVKSRQESRPVYVSKEYVRIQHPGDHLNIIDRPVDDDPSVKVRWGNQYNKFMASQEQVPEGTPNEILFPNQPEIPANLHTHGVHTVEQLATLSAHALQTIGMGSVEWQEKARKFLESAKGGVEYHRIQKHVEDLQSQNQVLQNQVSLMQAQLNRLSAINQQGINPLMVPASRPTIAEAHNQTVMDQAYKGPFEDSSQMELPALKTRTPRKGN